MAARQPDCSGNREKRNARPRRFPRYLTDLPLRVILREQDFEGYCNNISEEGLGVFLPEPFPVGSMVSLQFRVPTHPAAACPGSRSLSNWVPARSRVSLLGRHRAPVDPAVLPGASVGYGPVEVEYRCSWERKTSDGYSWPRCVPQNDSIAFASVDSSWAAER